MKLKKLLASCVLIAAMGITLTGCDLNIRGIFGESSSDTDYESSSDKDNESSRDTDYGSSSDTDYGNSNNTDNESSTDTNIENSNSGTWVLTETKYFAYKNGEEQYVSKQNEYYKYRCYFSGVTEDNFVKFQVSGGFYDPSNSKNNRTCDSYHLCSIPDTSYPAGGLVTLQVINYDENSINGGHGGSTTIAILYEDKEADGIEKDPFLDSYRGVEFYSTKRQEYTAWLDMGESDTFTATMPEEAENGERIAIVFEGMSAYDSWSGKPQNDYGGKVWYTWIYTFTE